MAIGAIGNSLMPVQGYFNSSGDLLKYMTSLSEQKKAASNSSSYFNQSMFNDLGKVSIFSNNLRSQISSMASLNQYSSSVGKSAASSDKDVLSATVAKNATVSSVTKTDVNVNQLASVQKNTGAALNASDNAFGSTFDFSITDNKGKTTTFSVGLSAADNNKSALQSMADKVNASNIGIKASLVEDKDNGTVSMQLSGTKTGGTDGVFTVNDTSAAGLTNISEASKNAEYSVNGVNRSSQTNDVKLIEGVTATLNKTGSTQITYTPDISSAVDSVKNFVSTFNSLKEAASGSQSLNAQMMNVASNYSKALGYSGLGMDSKGNLSITDESKLSQSISDGSFSKNFQGVSSFGNKLNDVARNAYKTAYNSAMQDNFKKLMDDMQKQSTPSNNIFSNMLNNLSSNAGLIFNMWA